MEAIRFIAGSELPLHPERLGKQVKGMLAVLKGRHSQAGHKSHARKATSWKKMISTVRDTEKSRLLQVMCKMLGVTSGQKIRRDSSLGFSKVLRWWRARWVKRVAKDPDLKLSVKGLHDSLESEAEAEKAALLAKHKWLAVLHAQEEQKQSSSSSDFGSGSSEDGNDADDDDEHDDNDGTAPPSSCGDDDSSKGGESDGSSGRGVPTVVKKRAPATAAALPMICDDVPSATSPSDATFDSHLQKVVGLGIVF